MQKTNIAVNAAACTECLCCGLRCSLAYGGAFNPETARIRIEPRLEPGGDTGIAFTDDCVEGCSLCARYCPSGALTRV